LTPTRKPGPEFGTELKAEALKIGLTMDVAIAGEHVFAIGKDELRVLTNVRAGKPVLIGKLDGLGNTRQIAVSPGHAFITSREEGLFIVDVSEPSQPKLVVLLGITAVVPARAQSADVELLFVRRIVPLFHEKCLACHGKDEAKIKGGLDLRTLASTLKGGDSETPGLIAGKPEESPMYLAVTRKHDDWAPMPRRKRTSSTRSRSAGSKTGSLAVRRGRMTRACRPLQKRTRRSGRRRMAW